MITKSLKTYMGLFGVFLIGATLAGATNIPGHFRGGGGYGGPADTPFLMPSIAAQPTPNSGMLTCTSMAGNCTIKTTIRFDGMFCPPCETPPNCAKQFCIKVSADCTNPPCSANREYCDYCPSDSAAASVTCNGTTYSVQPSSSSLDWGTIFEQGLCGSIQVEMN